MSVFWRITQDLGSLQSRSYDTNSPLSQTAAQPQLASVLSLEHHGEVPSGGEYPLRDIINQMSYLLGMRVPDGSDKDDLLLAIRKELCLCVAVLEANIECYRGIVSMNP